MFYACSDVSGTLSHRVPLRISCRQQIDGSYLKKFFLMFIYFWDRERQSMNGGGSEREGDTESETGSRLQAVSTEPDAGLELTDREILTWAEVGRPTDWATQAPQETPFRPEDTFRLRVRGWGTIYHATGSQKKAGVAILISDKLGFKLKAINKRWRRALYNNYRVYPPGRANNYKCLCTEYRSPQIYKIITHKHKQPYW